MIILSPGHGICSDKRNNAGEWTVKENHYHQKELMKKTDASSPPATVKNRIGHDSDYYTEEEGNSWCVVERLPSGDRLRIVERERDEKEERRTQGEN